jgi:hypothetical protein
MRPVLMLWLSVFAVASGGAVVTYVQCPGCIVRDRINTSCEWTGDTVFTLDPRNVGHQRHLVEDAQLVEELGIRYADAEFGRRFGVEHHGGLLENGRVRGECLARMFKAIENNHGVTSEQIRLARGQRNPVYDLAVGLLFLPLYSLGAAIACRRLGRRFSSNERHVRLVATGLASMARIPRYTGLSTMGGRLGNDPRRQRAHDQHPRSIVQPLGSPLQRGGIHWRPARLLADRADLLSGRDRQRTRDRH